MCSIGVFFGVWLFSFMNVMSICSGVLDNTRMRSVSVVIFSGIRLSTTMLNGLMSCACALDVSITKIFSRFSASMAGNLSGILSGICMCLLSYICAKIKLFREKRAAAEKICTNISHADTLFTDL